MAFIPYCTLYLLHLEQLHRWSGWLQEYGSISAVLNLFMFAARLGYYFWRYTPGNVKTETLHNTHSYIFYNNYLYNIIHKYLQRTVLHSMLMMNAVGINGSKQLTNLPFCRWATEATTFYILSTVYKSILIWNSSPLALLDYLTDVRTNT